MTYRTVAELSTVLVLMLPARPDLAPPHQMLLPIRLGFGLGAYVGNLQLCNLQAPQASQPHATSELGQD